MNTADTYEQDFVRWIDRQARLLKNRRFEHLDLEHLIDEIEAMARNERRALDSRMIRLIQHLLKLEYQPDYPGNRYSWVLTVNAQRQALSALLEDSPSLQTKFQDGEWFNKIWLKGVHNAALETGIAKQRFPQTPIWPIRQILNEDFFPNAETLD